MRTIATAVAFPMALAFAFALTAGTAYFAWSAPSSETVGEASAAITPLRAVVPNSEMPRGPVDLVLSPDDAWLVAINQKSSTATLIRTRDRQRLDEVPVRRNPAAIALAHDGKTVLVTGGHSGDLTVLQVDGDKLKHQFSLHLGFEPHGVAVSPHGDVAYVALAAAHQVAVVDLAKREIAARIEVGRWPRSVALTPDGTKLVVAIVGDGGLAIVDTQKRELLSKEKFKGLNLGQIEIGDDGHNAYVPWMFYGDNPTTPGNITIGWVLGSRIGRIGLDTSGIRNGLSLDPRGRAVADPYGLAITKDDAWMVVSTPGTHELLMLAKADLPFIGIGGGEHIDPKLLADTKRFGRIDVGGRPLAIRAAGDHRTVYVANYLTDEIQAVDLNERKLVHAIKLSEPRELGRDEAVIARGEEIFYDATFSHHQWYSCHSCHQGGGGNIELIDTFNDGSPYTYKTVLPLYNIQHTGPWTWHGWQQDLKESIHNSITTTMRGQQSEDPQVDALLAYMSALELPPNPHRQADGSLNPLAEQGKEVFNSAKAGCADCHTGPYFTDGLVHDVGLGSRDDRYKGYNTPSLLGAYRKVRFFHHGRAHSLEEVVSGLHNPEKVTGQGDLTDQERAALVEYLKSL